VDARGDYPCGLTTRNFSLTICAYRSIVIACVFFVQYTHCGKGRFGRVSSGGCEPGAKDNSGGENDETDSVRASCGDDGVWGCVDHRLRKVGGCSRGARNRTTGRRRRPRLRLLGNAHPLQHFCFSKLSPVEVSVFAGLVFSPGQRHLAPLLFPYLK
jgi:hypothetical protein